MSIGHEAGAALKTTGQGVNKLPDGSIRLPRTNQVVTQMQFDDIVTRVTSNADAMVGRHLADLGIDDARRVARAACRIKDYAEVVNSANLEQMATNALLNFGGDATFRFRVMKLAEDMASAQSASDMVSQFAVAYICESV